MAHGGRAEGVATTEYYPAGNVVAGAARVVSGAGCNVMADMMFRRDCHAAVPFPRRFDDQAGRPAAWRPASADGAREAAEAVSALVR